VCGAHLLFTWRWLVDQIVILAFRGSVNAGQLIQELTLSAPMNYPGKPGMNNDLIVHVFFNYLMYSAACSIDRITSITLFYGRISIINGSNSCSCQECHATKSWFYCMYRYISCPATALILC
jgi:hypothetical protein